MREMTSEKEMMPLGLAVMLRLVFSSEISVPIISGE